MAVIVDLERRTVQAPITELGVSDRAAAAGGAYLRLRAELGTRAHQQYRRRRESDPLFAFEVPVRLAREVDGFSVELRGRMDGCRRAEGRILIEEVKSVTLGRADLARAAPESFPDWSFQLCTYALALAGAEAGEPLECRLVLVSLLDDHVRELSVPFDAGRAAGQLAEAVRRHIERARAERERFLRRRALAGRLRFPYPQLRPAQQTLMERMRRSFRAGRPLLAMAPTGTGKTAAALLEGLRFALENDAALLYLTSRTPQQEQVARAFEEMAETSGLEPGSLAGIQIGSRERLCPARSLLCDPRACERLADFERRLERSGARERLLGAGRFVRADDIVAECERANLCPFALTQELLPGADVLVGDSNYAYDPGAALGLFFGDGAPARAVIVLDEAHSLFDRAREAYSSFVSAAELRSLAARIERGEFSGAHAGAAQLAFSGVLSAIDSTRLFSDLAELFLLLADLIPDLARRARPEEPAFEDCRVIEPDRETLLEHCARAALLSIRYFAYRQAFGLPLRDDPVGDVLDRLQRLRLALSMDGDEFAPYHAGPDAPGGEGFGVLCLNPARRLEERHRQALGVAAMSGTLLPLSYWADVLGLAPLDCDTLALASPFPRENLGVFIRSDIETTLRARGRYYENAARIIETTVAARPGHYAAFFPSFAFLEEVRRRLDPKLSLLVQRPAMSEPERRAIVERMRDDREALLLLAVMGGAFGEGLDLPGAALIGAVIIGLGLPQVSFARERMRVYFERATEHGFAYAMLYPGLQRVVQAAGRVIRDESDVGVLVLADRRFAWDGVRAALPDHWLGPDLEAHFPADLGAALADFWAKSA